MSILNTLETDAVSLYKEAASLVTKAKVAWQTFSSTQNRALALTLFADAVKAVNDAATAVEAGTINVTLDADVVADIKKVIADAKAGDGVIKTDLALVGIKL